MRESKVIPNEPAQIAVVVFAREMQYGFGPNAGKTVRFTQQYAGISARNVSAEMGSGREELPVTWRFISGAVCGGDNVKDEPAWTEFTIDVPAKQKNVRTYIEKKLFSYGQGFRWFLSPKKESRIVAEPSVEPPDPELDAILRQVSKELGLSGKSRKRRTD
jgi:hypothetical protein